jgi:hypothetical protein
MDPLVKAWFEMYRESAGKEVMVPSAASAMATPAPTPPVTEEPDVMEVLAATILFNQCRQCSTVYVFLVDGL